MPTASVADRVLVKLPRPTSCPCCGSNEVHLQKLSFMGLPRLKAWDMIWHCGQCDARVGCHEGTAIPLGTLADRETRRARYLVHNEFDPLWRKHGWKREEAYRWLATTLGVSYEQAHIGMLGLADCNRVLRALERVKANAKHPNHHWSVKKRKKRNK